MRKLRTLVVAHYGAVSQFVRDHIAQTGTRPSYDRVQEACGCSRGVVWDCLRLLWHEEPALASVPWEPVREYVRRTAQHTGACPPSVARRIVHLLTTDDGAAERMARLMGGYHRVSC